MKLTNSKNSKTCIISSAGKRPHDKGGNVPLCSLQPPRIHICIRGADPHYLSGTPLQHKGGVAVK